MKLTGLLLGHREFGRMGHVTNQLSFGLAPDEQKIFPDVKRHVVNVIRRFRAKALIVAPPFIVGYQIYLYCKRENLKESRKNPADFASDT